MTRIPRFHCPGLPSSGRVPLDREATRHALKTLRLGEGDRVRLFDGRGREVEALLLPRGRGAAEAEILGEVPAADEGAPERILAFSPPRGERLEWLVEKGTELGATAFQPLLWERTPPRARSFRRDRLERIAAAACGQCGRAKLPVFLPSLPLEEFLRKGFSGAAYLLDREGAPPPPGAGEAGEILLAAGPEGGWTRKEKKALLAEGFRPLRAGAHVLRIETALLAGLALLAPPPAPKESPGRGGREGPT